MHLGHGADPVDAAVEPLPRVGGKLRLVDGQQADDGGEIVFHAMIQLAEQHGLGVGVAARLVVKPRHLNDDRRTNREEARQIELVGKKRPAFAPHQHQHAQRLAVAPQQRFKNERSVRQNRIEPLIQPTLGNAILQNQRLTAVQNLLREALLQSNPKSLQRRTEWAGDGTQGKLLGIVFSQQPNQRGIDLQRSGGEFHDALQHLAQLAGSLNGGVQLKQRVALVQDAFLLPDRMAHVRIKPAVGDGERGLMSPQRGAAQIGGGKLPRAIIGDGDDADRLVVENQRHHDDRARVAFSDNLRVDRKRCTARVGQTYHGFGVDALPRHGKLVHGDALISERVHRVRGDNVHRLAFVIEHPNASHGHAQHRPDRRGKLLQNDLLGAGLGAQGGGDVGKQFQRLDAAADALGLPAKLADDLVHRHRQQDRGRQGEGLQNNARVPRRDHRQHNGHRRQRQRDGHGHRPIEAKGRITGAQLPGVGGGGRVAVGRGHDRGGEGRRRRGIITGIGRGADPVSTDLVI